VRRFQRFHAGFTLLELIVVLALLALAGSLVAPRLTGLAQGRGSEEESRRLLAALTHGRELAIGSGGRVVFTLDADGRRYGLRAQRNGSTLASFDTNARLTLQAITTEGEPNEGPAEVTFLPDGQLAPDPPAAFRIDESGKFPRTLKLDPEKGRYVVEVAP